MPDNNKKGIRLSTDAYSIITDECDKCPYFKRIIFLVLLRLPERRV